MQKSIRSESEKANITKLNKHKKLMRRLFPLVHYRMLSEIMEGGVRVGWVVWWWCVGGGGGGGGV